MTIDAHQHFWDIDRFTYPWMTRDMTVLCRNYLPADLKPQLAAAGVGRTVFVQANHDLDENRWVLQLADEHDFIAGVVGWVDLTAADVEAQLDEFAPHPRFVGVRHLVHDEPDDDWIVRDDVLRGLRAVQRRGLAFDLLFRPRHLRHVPALAAALPELPMVIDHIAKPPIASGRLDGWLDDMRIAAGFDNVYCKLSGMVTEADHRHWTPGDLRPYVKHVIDLFGFDRLMFGSDWPVCRLAGEYGQVLAAMLGAVGPLGDTERTALLGGTAGRCYRLR